MDLKAQIEQFDKINEEKVRKIVDLKRENEELSKSQNKTAEAGKMDVTKRINIWKEESEKDKVDFYQLLEQQQEYVAKKMKR